MGLVIGYGPWHFIGAIWQSQCAWLQGRFSSVNTLHYVLIGINDGRRNESNNSRLNEQKWLNWPPCSAVIQVRCVHSHHVLTVWAWKCCIILIKFLYDRNVTGIHSTERKVSVMTLEGQTAGPETTCLLSQTIQRTTGQLKPLQSMEICFAWSKRIVMYSTQTLYTKIFEIKNLFVQGLK